MIDLEQLRRDMAEGTQGPWVADLSDPGDVVVWKVTGEFVCNIGQAIQRVDVAFDLDETNARRIARLPDLEQAYLDAIAERDRLEKVAKAAEELAKRVSMKAAMEAAADKSSERGDEEGAIDLNHEAHEEWDRCLTALDNYRKATKGNT